MSVTARELFPASSLGCRRPALGPVTLLPRLVGHWEDPVLFWANKPRTRIAHQGPGVISFMRREELSLHPGFPSGYQGNKFLVICLQNCNNQIAFLLAAKVHFIFPKGENGFL